MPGLHSKKSPSSAHRWRPCPASVREEEGLPDTAGEEAIQGTVFHDYAADCAELGLEPHHLVGDRMMCEDGKYRPFTEEMARKMLPGLDMIWSLADAPKAKLYVEVRLDLSRWLGPNEFGTSDAAIVNVPQKKLAVFDWKWGAGVPVSPDHNDQAILYTLGVWATIAEDQFEGADPEEIEVSIIIEQPRAPGGGGIWVTTMAEILSEGEKIKADAMLAETPDAPHNPGEKQCKFCKAAYANTCAARNEFLQDLLAEVFDEPENFDFERALDPERRSEILLSRSMIEKWLNQLHDEAMEDAKMGRPVPGMKRVAGRNSPRRWADAKKAEIIVGRALGDSAWTKKLVSPTQTEELVGREKYRYKYEKFVADQEAKPILVPESDPRDPIPDHGSMLDDVWGDDEAENLI